MILPFCFFLSLPFFLSLFILIHFFVMAIGDELKLLAHLRISVVSPLSLLCSTLLLIVAIVFNKLLNCSVIDAFGKYIDEEKALSKAKEKLARTALDVEVCRKRLNGNHDESKTQEIQNEYGQLQLKLDNYKVFLLRSALSIFRNSAQ